MITQANADAHNAKADRVACVNCTGLLRAYTLVLVTAVVQCVKHDLVLQTGLLLSRGEVQGALLYLMFAAFIFVNQSDHRKCEGMDSYCEEVDSYCEGVDSYSEGVDAKCLLLGGSPERNLDNRLTLCKPRFVNSGIELKS